MLPQAQKRRLTLLPVGGDMPLGLAVLAVIPSRSAMESSRAAGAQLRNKHVFIYPTRGIRTLSLVTPPRTLFQARSL